MAVGLLPAQAAAQEAIPHTSILDSLDGSSAGEAVGVVYVPLPGVTPGRRVASFSRQSRIEYARGIPSEGTLEWWINLDGTEQDQVPMFSTDSMKLVVAANGDVSVAGGLEAKGTPLRFNSWHAIGVSYGSQGAAIMVDGKTVATAASRIQMPAALSIGGFSGTLALFRASSAQMDWYLARGVTVGFRQPEYLFQPGKDGVSIPRLIRRVDPQYSEEARKGNLQGTVVLEVVIDEKGQPTRFKIVKPLGLGLDEEAVVAVKQWRFSPAMREGKPVPVWIHLEVNFRLRNDGWR